MTDLKWRTRLVESSRPGCKSFNRFAAASAVQGNVLLVAGVKQWRKWRQNMIAEEMQAKLDRAAERIVDGVKIAGASLLIGMWFLGIVVMVNLMGEAIK